MFTFPESLFTIPESVFTFARNGCSTCAGIGVHDRPESAQRAYFGIFGFGGDPTVVTEAVGLEPTKSWTKGDASPSPLGRRTHDRWELGLGATESAGFESQIEKLLDILEPQADAVRAAAKRWEAGICCVGKYRTEFNPEVHLSAEVIRRVASLGLSVDFDLYFLGGADEAS